MRIATKPQDVNVFSLLVHDTTSVQPFGMDDVTEALNLEIERRLVGEPFRLLSPNDCGLRRWIVDAAPDGRGDEGLLTRRMHSVEEVRRCLPADVVRTLDAVNAAAVEFDPRD